MQIHLSNVVGQRDAENWRGAAARKANAYRSWMVTNSRFFASASVASDADGYRTNRSNGGRLVSARNSARERAATNTHTRTAGAHEREPTAVGLSSGPNARWLHTGLSRKVGIDLFASPNDLLHVLRCFFVCARIAQFTESRQAC